MSMTGQIHGSELSALCTRDTPSIINGRTRWIVAMLCLLGGLRVLVFCAAFPFFGNVDEEAHADLIYKYSRAHVPKGLEAFNRGSARLIVLYGSWEFSRTPIDFPPEQSLEPLWKTVAKTDPQEIDAGAALWTRRGNHESMQPPVYYALTGAGFKLGALLGLQGGTQLYFVRFLNAPIFAGLVWLAFMLCREVFPDNAFVYLGVPAVIAVLPQDVFYSLNNDVLLAPSAALTFLLLIRWVRQPRENYLLSVMAGLAAAGAVLVKFTNVPICAVVVAAAIIRVTRAPRGHRPILPAILLLICAAAPVALWMLRNYLLLGEVTGNGAKLRSLGWTPLPVSAYWQHPIFTPVGFAKFWAELMNTLWTGELHWQGRRLGAWGISALCVAAATILPLCFVIGHWKSNRLLVIAGLALVAMYVSLMAWLSMAFDFGQCFYPSKAWPYFTSGRLILGVIVPLLAMCVGGLDIVFAGSRSALRWPVLIAFAGVLLMVEIVQLIPVFSSHFNWFHL